MKSRAARLTLLILFIVSLGATTFLFWKGESLESEAAAAMQSFDDTADAATRAVLEFRAAQQAYVAAGQSGELWTGRAAQALDAIGAHLEKLRGGAGTEAAAEVAAGISALNGLRQLDRRGRD